MAAFASLQQFADFMQATITNSAGLLAVEAATATIQQATGQQFFYVADEEITVRGNAGRIFLPQRPVHSVASVSTRWIGDAEVTTRVVDLEFTRWGHELTWTAGGYVRLNASPRWGTYGYEWPEYVTVVYTHGYQTMPADVVMGCLQLAAELYTSPDGAGYESIDDYAWRRTEAGTTPAAVALKALVARYGQRARMVTVR